MTIRIGIMGYGNLGRGIENAIHDNPDMQLQAVFTRRNPDNVKICTAGVPVVEDRCARTGWWLRYRFTEADSAICRNV